MSDKSPNPLIELEPWSQIQQLLSRDILSESELQQVAHQLSRFSEAALDASQTALYRGSVTLSQLLELAAIGGQQFPDNPQVTDEILQFVRQHVPALARAADSNSDDGTDVEEFVECAQAKWADYLEFLTDAKSESGFPVQNWEQQSSPPMDDSSRLAGQELQDSQAVDNVSETSSKQIDLMLSAISNLDGETPACDQPNLNPDDGFTLANVLGEAGSDSLKSTIQDARIDLSNDNDLLEAFLDDAMRCLDSMEKSTMTVESNPEDSDSLQQFCRELHTLKGASASVGLSELATYLHDLESSLDTTTDETPIPRKVESMFAAVDRMREEIARLGQKSTPLAGESTDDEPQTGSVEAPQNRTPDFSSVVSGDQSMIRIRASKLDRLMDMLAELVVLRNRRESHVAEFAEINEELTRCASRLSFAEEHPHATRHQVTDGFSEVALLSGSKTLSELAKDFSVVTRSLRELQKPVIEDNLAISHFIRDFRQELMQLRRMPVSGLFNRLQRAARDAAKVEGKRVQVEIVGGEAGLEQELQERLFEPLLHIVRNAVSHGIEPEDKRLQSGKNGCGTITLAAHCSPQLLVIEVRDDGHGLDYDAIRRRANEKGILVANHTATQDELGKLIFHPGFSTRDRASEVSGRGVGMDVVTSAVDQMRGRIEIDSISDQGTTMRLSIPLRSGIEHVMVFRSAGQLFALPMQTVTAAKSVQACDSSINKFSLASMLSLSGNKQSEHEVLILRKRSGLNDRKSTAKGELATPAGIGLEVDEIVGPEEVVVRGLPSVLKRHPLFCGVTLSGAGETVLLLDSNQLTEFYQKYHSENQENQHADQEARAEHELPAARRVLVIDDSLSARKLLIKKLNTFGFTAVEAGDGIEGLEKLRNERFEIVFTDLDMPRLGGMEMLFDIQRGHYGDAPVVVVSSRSEDQFRFQAMDHGAVDYLIKPVSDKSLSRLLTNLNLIGQTS